MDDLDQHGTGAGKLIIHNYMQKYYVGVLYKSLHGGGPSLSDAFINPFRQNR